VETVIGKYERSTSAYTYRILYGLAGRKARGRCVLRVRDRLRFIMHRERKGRGKMRDMYLVISRKEA